jgi:hypothetical protein
MKQSTENIYEDTYVIGDDTEKNDSTASGHEKSKEAVSNINYKWFMMILI